MIIIWKGNYPISESVIYFLIFSLYIRFQRKAWSCSYYELVLIVKYFNSPRRGKKLPRSPQGRQGSFLFFYFEKNFLFSLHNLIDESLAFIVILSLSFSSKNRTGKQDFRFETNTFYPYPKNNASNFLNIPWYCQILKSLYRWFYLGSSRVWKNCLVQSFLHYPSSPLTCSGYKIRHFYFKMI